MSDLHKHYSSPVANEKLKAFERPTSKNVAPRIEDPLGHGRSALFLVDFVHGEEFDLPHFA
jgi:hypothetical protein